MAHVLHSNGIKFPKNVFLFCFVHQHRDDEIRRKPPVEFQLSLWDTSRWNQLGVPRKSQFYQSCDWEPYNKVIHLNHYSFSQLFQLLSHLVPLIVSNAPTEGVLRRNESVIFLMIAVIAPMNWIVPVVTISWHAQMEIALTRPGFVMGMMTVAMERTS